MYLLPPPTTAQLNTCPSDISLYPVRTYLMGFNDGTTGIISRVDKTASGTWQALVIDITTGSTLKGISVSTTQVVLSYGAVAYARCW